MKVKTIFDVVFNCDCGCKSKLNVGDFKDGQFSFTVNDHNGFHEVIIDKKDIKKIVKLLNKYEGKTL